MINRLFNSHINFKNSKTMKINSLLGILFLILFWSCQDSFINSESDIDKTSITLKTSNKKDVVKVLKSRAMRKNSDSLFEAYPQFMKEIPLEGTNAKITSIPVVLKNKDAYSRMFSLDINGEQKNVIYNMIPDSSSTNNSFSGNIIVTDLDGNVMSYIDVIDKQFKKITSVEPSFNIDDLDYTTYANCLNGCPFTPCSLCDLGEVVVIADDYNPPHATYIFFREFPNPEGDKEEPRDNSFSNGGNVSGDDANDSCPPGMIKDDNGNCVEPCPSGYVKDKDGNCKKKPCEGNPVEDVEIASQDPDKSGILGGMFGCNRIGGSCIGSGNRNKLHNGIDILNDEGEPIYSMYDGFVYNTPYQKGGAGYMVQIQSTLANGEVIIHTYFHLQESGRVQASTDPKNYVEAGQIIGYQGRSGNLAGAIEKDIVESHVHIETRSHDGSSSWDYDDNYEAVDPRDYLETTIDDSGNTTDDCN